MPKIIKREIVYAAVQAAAGQVAAIIGGSALRSYDVGFGYEGLKAVDRPVMGGALGMPGSAFGGGMGKVSLSWEMSGNGDSDSAEHAALYRACGMKEKINEVVGSEGVEYNLSSADHDLITIVVNQDGYQRKILDARATSLAINATSGDTVKCTAEFVGILAADSETAIDAVAPIYPTAMPPVVRGATLTLQEVGGDAVAGAVETLSVDFGLNTSLNPDMTATDGFARPVIVDRAIKITVNPEFDGQTDWVGKMRLNKDYRLLATFDSFNTVQNRVSIVAPHCRIVEPTDGDRNGVRTREVNFMAARSAAGDDELQIIFT